MKTQTVTGARNGKVEFTRKGLTPEEARVMATELVNAGYWVERWEE